jgi:hypothetical protein
VPTRCDVAVASVNETRPFSTPRPRRPRSSRSSVRQARPRR